MASRTSPGVEAGGYDRLALRRMLANEADMAFKRRAEAVFDFLSERLGFEVNSYEDLLAEEQQQETVLDERLEAIMDFVEETGRSPEDWFIYQQLNPSEMDDVTAIQVQMVAWVKEITCSDRSASWQLILFLYAHSIKPFCFAASVHSRSGSGIIPTLPRSSLSASKHVCMVIFSWIASDV